jgi:hypothetical protein
MTDPWTALTRLIGRWEGTASGRPGVGHQERTYETVLGEVLINGTPVWTSAISGPVDVAVA